VKKSTSPNPYTQVEKGLLLQQIVAKTLVYAGMTLDAAFPGAGVAARGVASIAKAISEVCIHDSRSRSLHGMPCRVYRYECRMMWCAQDSIIKMLDMTLAWGDAGMKQ
jgi:hypothetical protein